MGTSRSMYSLAMKDTARWMPGGRRANRLALLLFTAMLVFAAETNAQSRPVIDPTDAGADAVAATGGIEDRTYHLYLWNNAHEAPTLLADAKADSHSKLIFKLLVPSPALSACDRLIVLEDGDAPGSPGVGLKDHQDKLIQAGQVVGGDATYTQSGTYPVSRIIVGYQQSGVNDGDSSGRLFVDIWTEHGILKPKKDVSSLTAFGNIRVGGAAQSSASTSSIGDFAAGLAGAAGSMKLNQVANTAEFLAGVSLNHAFSFGKRPGHIGIFGEYGASGSLQTTELESTYAFPAKGTQSYYQLKDAIAKAGIKNTCDFKTTAPKIDGVANNCMFIEFKQSQHYFDQEGYVGVRAVSFLSEAGYEQAAPMVMSIGFGANNRVNQTMDFNAMRVDGFVPFLMPKSKDGSARPVLYFFGSASLALDHGKFPKSDTFILLDPASSVKVQNLGVTPGAGNTFVLKTNPHPHEYYSIGAGVELKSLWNLIFK